jgi:hypothetical protein
MACNYTSYCLSYDDPKDVVCNCIAEGGVFSCLNRWDGHVCSSLADFCDAIAAELRIDKSDLDLSKTLNEIAKYTTLANYAKAGGKYRPPMHPRQALEVFSESLIEQVNSWDEKLLPAAVRKSFLQDVLNDLYQYISDKYENGYDPHVVGHSDWAKLLQYTQEFRNCPDR